ncbi:nucleotide exchange factor GrpE [Haematospirillum sp. H1815]|uniref:nucleotide exchange factor GrpE n=1 Tax=Haematospirillum sp. H1815 TaxID=2723108 RepID=UPI00143C254E|nr:nucleotide exchange factor GrpE [Haematospirillum sp. H1815]NKD77048.1 nucleotide exchange factor GrpE [Haematospirillum sp. H1815]
MTEETDKIIPTPDTAPDAVVQETEATELPEVEGAAEATPEARIAELETEVERLKTEYLRALADSQNTRRMAQKQIEDNNRYAVTNFARDVLAVADNLGRALLAAPAESRLSNAELGTLAVGVEMTEKELLSVLSRHGVTRIESLNCPFDPHHHQAMQEVERTDVPTGTVVQVYQDAWTLHDRLLRPAMVVVSKGGPKRDDVPAGGDDAPAPVGHIDQSV